jgi:hypothetical protein
MCPERLFLLRCFVSLLGVGVLVSVVDLTYCRWHGAACQVQRGTMRDAVMAATTGISGLLIRLPD